MTRIDQDPTGTAVVPGRDPRDGWTVERSGFPATRTPSFPRFPTKYGERSVTSPEVFTAEPLEAIPATAVLCYTKFLSKALGEVLEAHPESRESRAFPGLHYLNPALALVENTGLLGASMAAVQLERLIQLGIRSFIVLGIAGSLQEGVDIGHVVVGDRAVRDEGTSYHYLPSSDYAWPSPELTGQVAEHLRRGGLEIHVGGTWTTDAIFRETLLEVRELAQEGILTVEMEASALFSVAHFRGVEIAAVFVVSDRVHREDWERGQEGRDLDASLSRVLARLGAFGAPGQQVP
jgi:uridine phosphorylase